MTPLNLNCILKKKNFDYFYKSKLLVKIISATTKAGLIKKSSNFFYAFFIQITYLKFFKSFRWNLSILLVFEIMTRLEIFVSLRIFKKEVKSKLKTIKRTIIPVNLFKAVKYKTPTLWFVHSLKIKNRGGFI